MLRRFDTGLYVITDCKRLRFPEMFARTREILDAGILALQYRSKEATDMERAAQAEALAELCREKDTFFIVNDWPDIALECGADGVHLGKDDEGYHSARALLGDAALIGMSCYDRDAVALEAQDEGADYVAFGAFHPTDTKENTAAATPELLVRARSQLQIPIVAIGGITPRNGADLLEAGADILAVASSIYAAGDPAAVVGEFNALF